MWCDRRKRRIDWAIAWYRNAGFYEEAFKCSLTLFTLLASGRMGCRGFKEAVHLIVIAGIRKELFLFLFLTPQGVSASLI